MKNSSSKSKPNTEGQDAVSCEFCLRSFTPRRQTRNPRACPRDHCQKLRQKDNQAKWRQRERPVYDPKYHFQLRSKRQAILAALTKTLTNLLCIGARLKDVSLNEDHWTSLLGAIFRRVGMRFAKKLWLLISASFEKDLKS